MVTLRDSGRVLQMFYSLLPNSCFSLLWCVFLFLFNKILPEIIDLPSLAERFTEALRFQVVRYPHQHLLLSAVNWAGCCLKS